MMDTSRAWTALQEFRASARRFFKERAELVDCGLVALIANVHLFILGPPGTAKSMLAEALAGGISGANYFYVMLNKFLTWRDLACGEVIVREESDGQSRAIHFRNTEGPLLRAYLVFLDELFKASAATNNSLLNLLQERIYTINPGEVRQAPLLMAIAASNEMPGSDDDQLRAFTDRFLLWHEVSYIGISHDGSNAFIEMMEESDPIPSSALALEDVLYLRTEAGRIPVERTIIGLINSMRAALRLEHRIEPSDRRFKASLRAIKAFAFLNGHARVEIEDLAILEHILWAGRERETRDIVRRVVREFSGEAKLSTVEALYREANEVFRDALSLLDQADREIPFDETQRKRRDSLRNEALAKERALSDISSRIAAEMLSIATRRASALAQSFLNQTTVLRKALVNRRAIEDPFVGIWK